MGFELKTPYFAVVGVSGQVNRLRYRAELGTIPYRTDQMVVVLKTQ